VPPAALPPPGCIEPLPATGLTLPLPALLGEPPPESVEQP
jgi:hypothetical protein